MNGITPTRVAVASGALQILNEAVRQPDGWAHATVVIVLALVTAFLVWACDGNNKKHG